MLDPRTFAITRIYEVLHDECGLDVLADDYRITQFVDEMVDTPNEEQNEERNEERDAPGSRVPRIALTTLLGTICAETALTADEDTPARRQQIEDRYCTGGLHDPVRGSWTDVSDHDAVDDTPD